MSTSTWTEGRLKHMSFGEIGLLKIQILLRCSVVEYNFSTSTVISVSTSSYCLMQVNFI